MLGVGQQPQLFELVGGEQVGFVDDQHDVPAAFGFLGGERSVVCGISAALWKRGTPPSAVTMPW